MATKSSSSSSSNKSSTASSGKSSTVVSSSAPKASTPAGAKTPTSSPSVSVPKGMSFSNIGTFGNTNNMNSTSAPKMTTTNGAGGYSDTTFKNSDGSTTSMSNKPQYGTAGTVTNADGSKTVYNSGGGYTNYDKSGNTTGGGAYGTENWNSSGGNIGNLPGYSGGSSKDQSIAALGGDVNAINSLNNEQDLYNRLLSPQEALGLTEEQRQQKYQEYLQTAHAQLDPVIKNYNDYLNVLKGQQQTDNHNLDMTYNQNANTMFANQFQQAGQLQQQMTERGLNGSGLSADALARSQMAGNMDLNNAFIAAQQQKADIGKQYNGMNYDINTKLAELSPEAMAARNIDGYGTAYLEQQTAQQAQQQKMLLDMYNTLLGNNTTRINNVNDNAAKVDMNTNDNSTKLSMNANDNTTILGKAAMDNQTVIDKAKLDSYTTITKTQYDNAAKIAIEGGKLQLAKDIQMSSGGYVYLNGKPLTYKGKQIPTLDLLKLSEAERHNVATENNVKDGQILDFNAAIDSNNAKREGDQLNFTQGMDANEVKRQQIAANISIASEKIKLGYANLDQKWAVLQANVNDAAANVEIAARNAGNKEAQTAIKVVQAKIDTITKQIGKGEASDKQKKQLKGLFDEIDNIGKKVGTDYNNQNPTSAADFRAIDGLIP